MDVTYQYGIIWSFLEVFHFPATRPEMLGYISLSYIGYIQFYRVYKPIKKYNLTLQPYTAFTTVLANN